MLVLYSLINVYVNFYIFKSMAFMRKCRSYAFLFTYPHGILLVLKVSSLEVNVFMFMSISLMGKLGIDFEIFFLSTYQKTSALGVFPDQLSRGY